MSNELIRILGECNDKICKYKEFHLGIINFRSNYKEKAKENFKKS